MVCHPNEARPVSHLAAFYATADAHKGSDQERLIHLLAEACRILGVEQGLITCDDPTGKASSILAQYPVAHDDTANALPTVGTSPPEAAAGWQSVPLRYGKLRWGCWHLRPSPARPGIECQTILIQAMARELEKCAPARNASPGMIDGVGQAILDSANVAIVAVGLDNRITLFNRAAERMFGYRAEEAVDRLSPEILHDPEELLAATETLRQETGQPDLSPFDALISVALEGQVVEREWTLIHQSGYRFPALLSITVLRDHRGNAHGYLGVVVDLTPHRELEAARRQIQESQLARDLVRAIGQGVLCFESAPPHAIRFLNPQAEALLGIPETSALGTPLGTLIQSVGDDGFTSQPLPNGLPAEPNGAFEALLRTHRSPLPFAAAMSLCALGSNDDLPLWVMTLQDITARRDAEQWMLLAAQVFEHSAEAIMVTDGDGTILNVNPAFSRLTGYQRGEVLGRSPRLLKSGQHDDAFYAQMWRALKENGHWEGEVWDRRRDGSHYPKWLTISAIRQNGTTTHYVAFFSDISERKRKEHEIRFLADHDQLTGLPNRRLLESRAGTLLTSERRHDHRLALMMIDLDRFKQVNDTLGHAAGDQLLVEVAHRLTACVRGTDSVIRLGGDEFVVLLENINSENDVAAVARKIHEALNHPFDIERQSVLTPPSIGVALYPSDGHDIDTLLKSADQAMYRVKLAGRNGWMFHAATMNAEVHHRHQLERDLEQAVEFGGFVLEYQPQFDLNSGSISRWEALLRWPHPTRGLLAPAEFLSTANETGLMITLGEWVLRQACQTVRAWAQQGIGDYPIAINISACQLRHPGFHEMADRILSETRMPRDKLALEISESALRDAGASGAETLYRLRQQGITLVLDDVGTGTSALEQWLAAGISQIKIDPILVNRLEEGGRAEAVIRGMISLGTALDIAVVAEGVETDYQHHWLTENGCGFSQGYLHAPPLSEMAARTYLAGHPRR